MDKIFKRFFTESSAFVNEVPTGTGIGLSLVKELAELHHGFISVNSILNKGTKFILELPLDKEFYIDKNLKIPSENEAELYTNNFSTLENEVQISDKEDLPLILIAEDNVEIRKFIKDDIIQNFRIIESINGVDAFDKAVNNIPDLILSDVLMPEMDGIELCEKLKTDERTSHIPVMLLTSRSAVENKIKGLETGADDYITKPFIMAELKIRINNLITQRRNLRKRYRKEIIYEAKDFAVTSTDENF